MIEFSITSAGAKLHAISGGKGDSVILLHAGVADKRMWQNNLASIAETHKAIAYDRRGFGNSTSPDEAFSHVADLLAVLDHVGGDQHILIGSSQGGRIAIDFALNYPDRVVALVLAGTALTGATSPRHYPAGIDAVFEELERAEEGGDLTKVNHIEARLWLDGPLACDGRVMGNNRELFLDMNGIALNHAPFSDESFCESAVQRLNEIKVPTLFITGDLDFPHIQERSSWMAKEIPEARSVMMKGCAHLPSLELSSQFDLLVRKFLGKASAI